MGHYASQRVSPKKCLAEFRVRDEAGLPPVGEQLGAGWFVEGQFVDAKSKGKGKGFAGVGFFFIAAGWCVEVCSDGLMIV